MNLPDPRGRGLPPSPPPPKCCSHYCLIFAPPTHRQITVGDPTDSTNKMGALVSKEHLAKVTGYVELARREGCTVLCGHGVEELALPEGNKNGYFMRPTVITDVSDDSKLMQEEVFGPVTCIVPFKTEEEVCKYQLTIVVFKVLVYLGRVY